MAHVMEEEATYLKNLGEDLRPKVIGPFLKYIFPILRRALTRITVLDRLTFIDRVDSGGDNAGFTDFVYEVILDETFTIFAEQYHRPAGEPTLEELRGYINLRQLAERTAKTISGLTNEEIPAI